MLPHRAHQPAPVVPRSCPCTPLPPGGPFPHTSTPWSLAYSHLVPASRHLWSPHSYHDHCRGNKEVKNRQPIENFEFQFSS
ncbi:hypothetical protein V6N11_039040 [Hibiscus sabdariffa]|uniref:Uncharacterized protein n=1 Tax=Hibiscus sabdariffa TaxID=183260 RepID=A0ABR2SML3_9ROSI